MKKNAGSPLLVLLAFLIVLPACAPTVSSAADSCQSPGDQAFLPDDALRGGVEDALGKRGVTCEELSTLTELRAINRGIRSLEGLQHATSLSVLGLQANELTDLTPLADLHLTTIFLGSNRVTDLTPLSGMLSLETLALELNEGLSDLSPLAGLPQLEFISIQATAVTDLNVLKDLPALTAVSLGGNHGDYTVLTELSGLRHLTTGQLPADQLHILPQLPGLTHLYLHAPTGYDDLSFLAQMPQLESLYVRLGTGADLNDLTVLTNLSELDLRFNDLTDITPLLAIEQLSVLDVRDNCLPADMAANAAALELELRGVDISYDPQRSEGCSAAG